jgi:uncharacterized membrane protein YeaQ/YmgE (transglycosylase-associated protein family)
MRTNVAVGIFGALLGSAFLMLALFRTGSPRQRRLIFAYIGICFYIYGALEFFGVVRLESL